MHFLPTRQARRWAKISGSHLMGMRAPGNCLESRLKGGKKNSQKKFKILDSRLHFNPFVCNFDASSFPFFWVKGESGPGSFGFRGFLFNVVGNTALHQRLFQHP
jgi:hypothetical protein